MWGNCALRSNVTLASCRDLIFERCWCGISVPTDEVHLTPESSPELTKKSWFGSLMSTERDETYTILVKDKALATVKADLIHAFLSVSFLFIPLPVCDTRFPSSSASFALCLNHNVPSSYILLHFYFGLSSLHTNITPLYPSLPSNILPICWLPWFPPFLLHIMFIRQFPSPKLNHPYADGKFPDLFKI